MRCLREQRVPTNQGQVGEIRWVIFSSCLWSRFPGRVCQNLAHPAGNRWSLEWGSLYSNPWCSQYISHCSCLPPALQGLCSAITGYHGQTLTWRHCSSFTSNLWCEEWLEMVLLLKVRLFIARCSCCFQSMSHTGTARNSLYSILFVSIYLKCWVFGIGVHSSWSVFVHFSMRYKTLSLNIIFLFNPVQPRKNFRKNKGRRKKHPKTHKRKNSYP